MATGFGIPITELASSRPTSTPVSSRASRKQVFTASSSRTVVPAMSRTTRLILMAEPRLHSWKGPFAREGRSEARPALSGIPIDSAMGEPSCSAPSGRRRREGPRRPDHGLEIPSRGRSIIYPISIKA